MIIRKHWIAGTALACGIMLFLAWIMSFELWMRLHRRQSRLAPGCLKVSNFIGRLAWALLIPSLAVCAFFAVREGEVFP